MQGRHWSLGAHSQRAPGCSGGHGGPVSPSPPASCHSTHSPPGYLGHTLWPKQTPEKPPSDDKPLPPGWMPGSGLSEAHKDQTCGGGTGAGGGRRAGVEASRGQRAGGVFQVKADMHPTPLRWTTAQRPPHSRGCPPAPPAHHSHRSGPHAPPCQAAGPGKQDANTPACRGPLWGVAMMGWRATQACVLASPSPGP